MHLKLNDGIIEEGDGVVVTRVRAVPGDSFPWKKCGVI
jgi:hypothetical protein